MSTGNFVLRRFTSLIAGAVFISLLFYLHRFYVVLGGQDAKLKDFQQANESSLSDNVTVVAAYFNLGSFPKGSQYVHFTIDHYRRWMAAFACIENPVVFYSDSDEDMALFAKHRSHLRADLTKMIKINRSDTWAFQLEPRITEIFRQPGYPQHLPNTVVPAYSMAMHAKYECVQRTISENPFRTKYFSWLDIGYFRDVLLSGSSANLDKPNCVRFSMQLPPNFTSDSVAFNQISERNPTLTAAEIVRRNDVWLGGGFFIGERSVLVRWIEEYREALEAMLSEKQMSTDQQVIYYMFNTRKPKTKLQVYASHGPGNVWFYLGYLSRRVT